MRTTATQHVSITDSILNDAMKSIAVKPKPVGFGVTLHNVEETSVRGGDESINRRRDERENTDDRDRSDDEELGIDITASNQLEIDASLIGAYALIDMQRMANQQDHNPNDEPDEVEYKKPAEDGVDVSDTTSPFIQNVSSAIAFGKDKMRTLVSRVLQRNDTDGDENSEMVVDIEATGIQQQTSKLYDTITKRFDLTALQNISKAAIDARGPMNMPFVGDETVSMRRVNLNVMCSRIAMDRDKRQYSTFKNGTYLGNACAFEMIEFLLSSNFAKQQSADRDSTEDGSMGKTLRMFMNSDERDTCTQIDYAMLTSSWTITTPTTEEKRRFELAKSKDMFKADGTFDDSHVAAMIAEMDAIDQDSQSKKAKKKDKSGKALNVAAVPVQPETRQVDSNDTGVLPTICQQQIKDITKDSNIIVPNSFVWPHANVLTNFIVTFLQELDCLQRVVEARQNKTVPDFIFNYHDLLGYVDRNSNVVESMMHWYSRIALSKHAQIVEFMICNQWENPPANVMNHDEDAIKFRPRRDAFNKENFSAFRRSTNSLAMKIEEDPKVAHYYLRRIADMLVNGAQPNVNGAQPNGFWATYQPPATRPRAPVQQGGDVPLIQRHYNGANNLLNNTRADPRFVKGSPEDGEYEKYIDDLLYTGKRWSWFCNSPFFTLLLERLFHQVYVGDNLARDLRSCLPYNNVRSLIKKYEYFENNPFESDNGQVKLSNLPYTNNNPDNRTIRQKRGQHPCAQAVGLFFFRRMYSVFHGVGYFGLRLYFLNFAGTVGFRVIAPTAVSMGFTSLWWLIKSTLGLGEVTNYVLFNERAQLSRFFGNILYKGVWLSTFAGVGIDFARLVGRAASWSPLRLTDVAESVERKVESVVPTNAYESEETLVVQHASKSTGVVENAMIAYEHMLLQQMQLNILAEMLEREQQRVQKIKSQGMLVYEGDMLLACMVGDPIDYSHITLNLIFDNSTNKAPATSAAFETNTLYDGLENTGVALESSSLSPTQGWLDYLIERLHWSKLADFLVRNPNESTSNKSTVEKIGDGIARLSESLEPHLTDYKISIMASSGILLTTYLLRSNFVKAKLRERRHQRHLLSVQKEQISNNASEYKKISNKAYQNIISLQKEMSELERTFKEATEDVNKLRINQTEPNKEYNEFLKEIEKESSKIYSDFHGHKDEFSELIEEASETIQEDDSKMDEKAKSQKAKEQSTALSYILKELKKQKEDAMKKMEEQQEVKKVLEKSLNEKSKIPNANAPNAPPPQTKQTKLKEIMKKIKKQKAEKPSNSRGRELLTSNLSIKDGEPRRKHLAKLEQAEQPSKREDRHEKMRQDAIAALMSVEEIRESAQNA